MTEEAPKKENDIISCLMFSSHAWNYHIEYILRMHVRDVFIFEDDNKENC